MKCLIIAAGKGSRLWPKGKSKPLISILGVPLIERVIRSAMQAEIKEGETVVTMINDKCGRGINNAGTTKCH